MKETEKKAKRGWLLQIFLAFGLMYSSVVLIYAIVRYGLLCTNLTIREPVVGTILAVICAVAAAALGAFLSRILFRWYNTEKAIRRAIDEHATFEESLMEEINPQLYASVISMVGGFFAMMVSAMVGRQPILTMLAFGFCVLVVGSTLLVVITVIAVSLRLRSERHAEGDPRVIIWYGYDVINGNKIKAPRTYPASEVYREYW